MRAYDVSDSLLICENAKRKFGADYDRINWFSDAEAIRATQERNDLLAQIGSGLAKDRDGARGAKPHIGPISPGCRICQHGGWDCTWIHRRCTRSCQFCNTADDPRLGGNRQPYCREGTFCGPEDHALYFKLFNKKGLGISGGEPLLRFDWVLDHLKAVRGACEASYCWLYTNGDLATPFALRELANAGLDEIRLDLAAVNYDLERVALAKRFIPAVTVEIPCLPHDYDRLKDLLPRLSACGVSYLNLHQLMVGRHNYQSYMNRGYHFLHSWHTPVHESEMTALRLMKYAMDNRIDLPINYCAKIYKESFQERNYRMSYADLFLAPLESTTENGYFRRIRVRDTWDNIQSQAQKFRERNADPRRWAVLAPDEGMAVHPELLPRLDLADYQLKVEYYAPAVKKKDENGLFERGNLAAELTPILKSPWLSAPLAKTWQDLFLGTGDPGPENEIESEGFAMFPGMMRRERMISGLPDIE